MNDLQFRFREVDYVVKITQYPVADFGDDEDNEIHYKAEAYASGKSHWSGCVEYILENKVGDVEYLISECKKSIIDYEKAEEEAEEDMRKLGFGR